MKDYEMLVTRKIILNKVEKRYEKCCLKTNAFRTTLYFITHEQMSYKGLGFNITSYYFIDTLKTNIMNSLKQTFKNNDHFIKLNNSFKMFLDIVRAIYLLFNKLKDKLRFRYIQTTIEDLIVIFDRYKKEGVPPFDEILFYIVVGANLYFRANYGRAVKSKTYHYCIITGYNNQEHVEIPARLHLYHIVYDFLKPERLRAETESKVEGKNCRPIENKAEAPLHYMTHNIKEQMNSWPDYNIWEQYNFKDWYLQKGDKSTVRLFYKCRYNSNLWIPPDSPQSEDFLSTLKF